MYSCRSHIQIKHNFFLKKKKNKKCGGKGRKPSEEQVVRTVTEDCLDFGSIANSLRG